MRIRTAAVAAALAALTALAAGCGKDTCPTEAPQVNQLGDCTELPNATVSFPIKLCPTCNQTLSSCDADMSGVGNGSGNIFLNPVVEACTSSSSCSGASCSASTNTCTFKAPSTPGDYVVFANDAAHPGTPQEGALHVVAPGGTTGCSTL